MNIADAPYKVSPKGGVVTIVRTSGIYGLVDARYAAPGSSAAEQHFVEKFVKIAD